MPMDARESKGRDMEKQSLHIDHGLLENCNRHKFTAIYMNHLSHNFNRFKMFEYMIEVLEGSMDMMEILEEGDQAA